MPDNTNNSSLGLSRTIDTPAGLSDEMRQAMAQFPTPTLDAVKANSPSTKAQWLEQIHLVNTQQKKKVKAMRKQFNVAVELLCVAGVSVRRVTPTHISEGFEGKVYIDFHGGAYVFFSGLPSIEEGILIASRLGIVVYCVDYRMPPSSPSSQALDDAFTVYCHLKDSFGANNIFVGGTSAGGGLALSLLQKLKKQNIELPIAAYAGTPWADLSNASDSLLINEGVDRILVSYQGLLNAAAVLYAGIHSLSEPSVSPLYGDFTGLPPTILVSGTRDLFLSDTVRVNRKLRESGIRTQLEVFEGLSHADYLVAHNTPESIAIYKEIAQFFLNAI
ncbi:alpha/beta hydrolase fold domain-containing protein [Alteromonas sp. A081]|uniref:alpha/beta hydrolase fold domain-containing protein n=1 Tax=Alteromonas sp. A081 TaxID=3410269 RepID=UPI003B986641